MATKAKVLPLPKGKKKSAVKSEVKEPVKAKVPQLALAVEGVTKEQVEGNPNLSAFASSLQDLHKAANEELQRLAQKHSVFVTTSVVVTFHWSEKVT